MLNLCREKHSIIGHPYSMGNNFLYVIIIIIIIIINHLAFFCFLSFLFCRINHSGHVFTNQLLTVMNH